MHLNYIKLVILKILSILGLCNFKFSFQFRDPPPPIPNKITPPKQYIPPTPKTKITDPPTSPKQIHFSNFNPPQARDLS